MSVLLEDKWLTARKRHYCEVCGQWIEPGERYRRQRVIWEGEPGVWKAHELCDKAYFIAHRELGLYEDECPDFQDDVRPILERLKAEGREVPK